MEHHITIENGTARNVLNYDEEDLEPILPALRTVYLSLKSTNKQEAVKVSLSGTLKKDICLGLSCNQEKINIIIDSLDANGHYISIDSTDSANIMVLGDSNVSSISVDEGCKITGVSDARLEVADSIISAGHLKITNANILSDYIGSFKDITIDGTSKIEARFVPDDYDDNVDRDGLGDGWIYSGSKMHVKLSPGGYIVAEGENLYLSLTKGIEISETNRISTPQDGIIKRTNDSPKDDYVYYRVYDVNGETSNKLVIKG